ncbi:STAS domain-containing protein [Paractinoplanes lichenicola]|uniref:STAS domain-containing protein n=1 Tax=Paractinoplanes lichenicola TaxID=2802976 RepID=A0ABS1VTB1_9ACTN|nr:STAS domain-containing protein [Actinoplanes lichenicola]MBL7257706.1 STAS domain-containing protein [Actinoplanes lichenicola]
MTVENPPGLLHVRTTSAGAAAVNVSVTGELDVSNSAWLRGWIVDTVDRWQPAGLNLDLGGTHFIDVAGVRALYELHAAVRARGCLLDVVAAHPAVWLTLDRLGLAPEFLTRPAPADLRNCA